MHAMSRLRLVGPAVTLLLATAGIVLAATPAAAGGWAVGTLDEVPAAEPGETVVVGFTIRQHGVTPVTLDEQLGGASVGIELVDGHGQPSFFAAQPDGAVGHYVAEVVVPDAAGNFAWTLHMGIFGPQDLGSIVVTDTAAPGDAGIWTPLRWVPLTLTIVLVAVAVVDLTAGRRRQAATDAVPDLAPVEPA